MMPHVNANAGGALRRNLVVDPDTGEPGVELECCRLMCWAAGQLESRGPRGCCIAWAGDCFYSARQYTFLVEGLPKIFANDHAVKNKLETAALSTMRSVGSTCFPRATLGACCTGGYARLRHVAYADARHKMHTRTHTHRTRRVGDGQCERPQHRRRRARRQ